MNEPLQNGPRSVRRLFLIWFGFLGGAMAWAGHLLIAYSLVPLACRNNQILVLYVATAATAVVATGAVIVAWSGWQPRESGPEHHIAARRVERFLALSGVLLSSLFLLVIIVQSLPIFLQSPCDTAGRLGI